MCPLFQGGFPGDNIYTVFILYPFSQSLSFGWGIQPITFKVIIDKYDPIAIYFIVLGSSLYTILVSPI